MICQIDEKGWCERHWMEHKGLSKILCLEDSSRGERYRARLDRSRIEVPTSGVGSQLKNLLADMGITTKPGCSCNRLIAEMNRLGPVACREQAPRLAEAMGANATFMRWKDRIAAAFKVASNGYFSFQSLILEACSLVEAKDAANLNLLRHAMENTETAVAPPKLYMGGITWAVGMTTVPEREELRERTLTSLEAAGFPRDMVYLSVDGGHGPTDWPGALSVRMPRINAWSNWWLTLNELFHRSPGADRYLMVQDDAVFVRSLREYLDAQTFPERGYLNLFSFSSNEVLMDGGEPGLIKAAMLQAPSSLAGEALAEWRKQGLQCGRGALAFVFDQDGLRDLLAHRGATDRPISFLSGRGKTKIDGGLVTAMNHLGRSEYVHRPSLVQHTGHKSIIGNGNRKDEHGRKNGEWKENLARSFPGENFDAMSWVKQLQTSK